MSFALPSLAAHKQRKLELRARLPATRAAKGQAASCFLKAVAPPNATWPPWAKPPTAP